MVHITALIRFQVEHRATVLDAMRAHTTASRAETGCLHYESFAVPNQALVITHEIWADDAAERAHMQGPVVAALVGKIGGMLAGAPEIIHCQRLE